MITNFKIFENYAEWKDDKKILNLEKLFDNCEGDLKKIFFILKYELRNSKNEIVLIKSYDGKTNVRIINVIDFGRLKWTGDSYRDAIIINTNIGEKNLYLNNFTDLYIEINKNRIFSENDPYGEEDWVNESVTEEIEVKKSLFEIFDHYITYFRVLEYLKKELIGKIVTVSGCYLYILDEKGIFTKNIHMNEWFIKIKDITLDVKHLLLHFIDEDGSDYILPDNTVLKWKTKIIRRETDEDPYGEEDWEL